MRDAGEPRVREWRHAGRVRQSLQESLLHPHRHVHRELNETASALKTGVCHIRVSNCVERPCGQMCRSKNTEFLRGRGLRATGRVGEESRKAMNRTVSGSPTERPGRPLKDFRFQSSSVAMRAVLPALFLFPREVGPSSWILSNVGKILYPLDGLPKRLWLQDLEESFRLGLPLVARKEIVRGYAGDREVLLVFRVTTLTSMLQYRWNWSLASSSCTAMIV